jgi:hypothetical protein
VDIIAVEPNAEELLEDRKMYLGYLFLIGRSLAPMVSRASGQGTLSSSPPQTPISPTPDKVINRTQSPFAGSASEIEGTFSMENGKPGFVHENTACTCKLNDSAFVALEQKHSV